MVTEASVHEIAQMGTICRKMTKMPVLPAAMTNARRHKTLETEREQDFSLGQRKCIRYMEMVNTPFNVQELIVVHRDTFQVSGTEANAECLWRIGPVGNLTKFACQTRVHSKITVAQPYLDLQETRQQVFSSENNIKFGKDCIDPGPAV